MIIIQTRLKKRKYGLNRRLNHLLQSEENVHTVREFKQKSNNIANTINKKIIVKKNFFNNKSANFIKNNTFKNSYNKYANNNIRKYKNFKLEHKNLTNSFFETKSTFQNSKIQTQLIKKVLNQYNLAVQKNKAQKIRSVLRELISSDFKSQKNHSNAYLNSYHQKNNKSIELLTRKHVNNEVGTKRITVRDSINHRIKANLNLLNLQSFNRKLINLQSSFYSNENIKIQTTHALSLLKLQNKSLVERSLLKLDLPQSKKHIFNLNEQNVNSLSEFKNNIIKQHTINNNSQDLSKHLIQLVENKMQSFSSNVENQIQTIKNVYETETIKKTVDKIIPDIEKKIMKSIKHNERIQLARKY